MDPRIDSTQRLVFALLYGRNNSWGMQATVCECAECLKAKKSAKAGVNLTFFNESMNLHYTWHIPTGQWRTTWLPMICEIIFFIDNDRQPQEYELVDLKEEMREYFYNPLGNVKDIASFSTANYSALIVTVSLISVSRSVDLTSLWTVLESLRYGVTALWRD